MPAAITACTAAGAPIGATARPSGVSVAWVVEAVIPLWASCLRMSATDSGSGSDAEAGPTLTPAVAGAEAGSILAAAPATGCTTWGWPCGSGASEAVEDAVDDAVAPLGPDCAPHAATPSASAASATTRDPAPAHPAEYAERPRPSAASDRPQSSRCPA